MSFTFDPTKAFGDPDPPDIPEDTSVLRDKVARFFRDHPDCWIDASRLLQLGGMYGWRSRVSECRTQLGMKIENRQRREKRRTISEYCFRPAERLFLLTSEDATGSEG
tara:strand:- start:4179 stop:4502 length:324 start_codon:yes stop_codon:yes gene_type:complete